MLLKGKKEMLRSAVYIVTTSERAEKVITRFRENSMGRYEIQGICLLDQDAVGSEILGCPVTATKDNLVQYLCDKWVDEVFVSIPISGAYPEQLINTITEMGIVVHVQVEQMHVEEWQRQTIEKFAGTTVRTLSLTMATPQELLMPMSVSSR